MRLLYTTITSTFLVSVITLLAVIRITQNICTKPQDENGLLYSFCSSLKVNNGIGIGIGIDSIQLPVVFIYNEHVKHLLIPDVGLKRALEFWLEAINERYSL